ncbi:MAG: carbohydrate-binding domain-containing protein [Clostridia bacterium]|nr:carbohydrate-binding domain-containing protein [Clostridia bacterium]
MKNRILTAALALLLCAALAFTMTGCRGGSSDPGQTEAPSSSDYVQATAASDSSVSASEVSGEFVMTSADGVFSRNGSVYTVTSAGTYSLRGALEGQILVIAGKEDVVVLELNGVTITNSSDSPIKILSADKVEISAKKGTDNVIKDERSQKTTDDDSQGGGAIWADADLKLKGAGTLVVTASYNNGIHTTKDLTIQKLSLKVTAVNAAIKGNDSIKIKSGTVVAISTFGDGMKTSSTDLNKSGETRGDIVFCGGSIAVYAAGDGIQAAHSFIMEPDEEGNVPAVSIFTGSYSDYTDDSASTDSYKGVKAESKIDISAGAITISSYDDGLHANCGTTFESGERGMGDINISGGSITIAVYSPEGKTGGGHMGPGRPGGHGGWGGQQTVSGADGIHADGALTISGGDIYIDSAYEGLEANVVVIEGGTTVVTAMDDGVNATKGLESPQVIVTGGILDVTVSPNGDVDGIDSNGTYVQTGGLVITRGPNSEMAAALDAESSVSITGGTLVVLGYSRVQAGSGVNSCLLSLNSEGEHSITVNGSTYTFTNAYSYGRTSCYSDTSVSGK